MELFDTTELRQTATLARYVETAAGDGQADLFAETVDGTTAEAAVDAVKEPATVTAYLAHTSRGGSNVYLPGVICQTCDKTFDPHYRHGVPCVNPYGHAAVTVSNWRFNGVADAQVVAVEVPVAAVADMITAARAAVEAAFAWPAPVGALLTREDAAGEMILS